jgi:hypothetical protein
MFNVFCPTQQPAQQAVIAWGWEDLAFCRRWFRAVDPDMADQLKGPVLNFGSPQSQNAGALLELTRELLLSDANYVGRIKRHYAIFRSKIDGPGNKRKKLKKQRRWTGRS